MPEITYAVQGFLTVRRRTLRVPLSGSLALRADLDSGTFTGNLALQPSVISRTVLGARLFSSTVQIMAEAPVTGRAGQEAGLLATGRKTWRCIHRGPHRGLEGGDSGRARLRQARTNLVLAAGASITVDLALYCQAQPAEPPARRTLTGRWADTPAARAALDVATGREEAK